MNNVINVFFNYINSSNYNIKTQITSQKIKLMNWYYSFPEVEEVIKEKGNGIKKDVVVTSYNRNFKNYNIELNLLIEKPYILNSLTTIFSQTYKIEFSINKSYNVKPYKLIINKEHKNYYNISLIFYVNESIQSELIYDLTPENKEIKNISLGNLTTDFCFIGENLNNSKVQLSIKTDVFDKIYTPIIDIPFLVNNFTVDTLNNIYIADNKNLLDINNYSNIKEYRFFIRAITNLKEFNFNKADLKVDFQYGTCYLKIYKREIY